MYLNLERKEDILYKYDRYSAYYYARRWAFDRNPNFYDFSNLGGNCTNYASQVLFAGGCPMNYARWSGWFYENVDYRAPAWTGVEYLYNFLMNNNETGPIARECTIEELEIGDIIQLNFGDDDRFDHTPVVVGIKYPINPDNIFVAANSEDRFDYRLSNYYYTDIRYIHIEGYKL